MTTASQNGQLIATGTGNVAFPAQGENPSFGSSVSTPAGVEAAPDRIMSAAAFAESTAPKTGESGHKHDVLDIARPIKGDTVQRMNDFDKADKARIAEANAEREARRKEQAAKNANGLSNAEAAQLRATIAQANRGELADPDGSIRAGAAAKLNMSTNDIANLY